MNRRLRAGVVVLVTSVALTACTSEPPEPEAVDECSGLVAVGRHLVEDYLEVVDELPLAVILGEAPVPAALLTLNERGRELDIRVVRLGCDVDEINDQIIAQTEDLTAATPVGEAFLGIVRSGVVGNLPELPPEPPADEL